MTSGEFKQQASDMLKIRPWIPSSPDISHLAEKEKVEILWKQYYFFFGKTVNWISVKYDIRVCASNVFHNENETL